MLILFFFLLLTFKKGQIYNCKGIIVFFFLLGSYTIPLLLFNGYSLAKFIQQYTLLFFCVFIYRQFFILNRTNLDALWNKYIRISYYVSVLGIIQFIICLFIGIDIFPNAFVPDGRVMRIHSIFQEEFFFDSYSSLSYCISRWVINIYNYCLYCFSLDICNLVLYIF